MTTEISLWCNTVFFYIHWQRECKNDPFCGHLSTFGLKSEVHDNKWNLYTALWATNLSRKYIFMSISHSSFKIMLIYIIDNNTTFCVMFLMGEIKINFQYSIKYKDYNDSIMWSIVFIFIFLWFSIYVYYHFVLIFHTVIRNDNFIF